MIVRQQTLQSITFGLAHSLIGLFLLGTACTAKHDPVSPSGPYQIANAKILFQGTAAQYIGANALHVFGGDTKDMTSWNLDIAREFVGNMKETPLQGTTIQDANGAFLHALQEIINNHRADKRIIVICPFGWDGTAATVFSGLRPSQTPFWNAYLSKLAQWAVYFKDQPDVWIEVWNEPYRFDRADGYTDDVWAQDMTQMVNVIRNAGNTNMILVPCAEQGQDESVLLNRGAAFLNGKYNILFDVHAYEKWLLVPNAQIGSRLRQLHQKNLPVFFGEMAPHNAGVLMNPKPFLDSAYQQGFSFSAWVWKYDGTDVDALLDASGQPNDNSNNGWGSLYKSVAAKTRKP
jgi:mannan endo-1,4-beta-mannosidase